LLNNDVVSHKFIDCQHRQSKCVKLCNDIQVLRMEKYYFRLCTC
jgi:hypothetical protein